MAAPYFVEHYKNMTFSQVWPSYTEFKTEYDALVAGFPQVADPLTADSVKTTYFLLYAKYGNNPIANSDVSQFKMKIISTMFAYGPTWQKKQYIQGVLRGLSETDLIKGGKQVFNHAYNPSSAPSTSSLDELTYIDSQNTSNSKKSKMEAYSILWNLLRADTTSEYIGHFKNCFAIFVDKMPVPFYIGEEDEIIEIEEA